MRRVYIDSGAFIALVSRRDQDHAPVTEHFRRLLAEGDQLVTSDPVIGETVTRLRYDAGLAAVDRFRDVVERSTTRRRLVIRESDAALRQAALAQMARYDGLALSYADAIGAVVATETRAAAVFGLDDHFRVMGFTVEP